MRRIVGRRKAPIPVRRDSQLLNKKSRTYGTSDLSIYHLWYHMLSGADALPDPVMSPLMDPENEPLDGSWNEPLDKSWNETLDGSWNEPHHRSCNEPLNESWNEPLDKSWNEPLDKSSNEPLDKSSNEPLDGSWNELLDISGFVKGLITGFFKGLISGSIKGLLPGFVKGFISGFIKGLILGSVKGLITGSIKGLISIGKWGDREGIWEWIWEGIWEWIWEGIWEGIWEQIPSLLFHWFIYSEPLIGWARSHDLRIPSWICSQICSWSTPESDWLRQIAWQMGADSLGSRFGSGLGVDSWASHWLRQITWEWIASRSGADSGGDSFWANQRLRNLLQIRSRSAPDQIPNPLPREMLKFLTFDTNSTSDESDVLKIVDENEEDAGEGRCFSKSKISQMSHKSLTSC